MRTLLAEDDLPLANFLSKNLEAEQYAVDVAAGAEEAKTLALRNDYDLLILDLGLPGVSGWELLAQMRKERATLPVLVLSAANRVEERVKILDLGADDYVTKPFSFAELAARARALLRRAGRPAQSVLRVQDLELDRLARTVKRAGRRIEVSPKEFALLELLMQHAGQTLTRAAILEQVWNTSLEAATNVVDVYINYVRKKVDEGFEPLLIRTVRGVGYQINAAGGKGR